jgi:hypothetical protein
MPTGLSCVRHDHGSVRPPRPQDSTDWARPFLEGPDIATRFVQDEEQQRRCAFRHLQSEVNFASGKGPMARTKVADADLRAYLDSGRTQAEAARHFGVSEPAIHQRLKRMRRLTSRVVALERAGAVVGGNLDGTAYLERVQCVIDEELTWAVEHVRGDGGDLITAFHASRQVMRLGSAPNRIRAFGRCWHITTGCVSVCARRRQDATLQRPPSRHRSTLRATDRPGGIRFRWPSRPARTRRRRCLSNRRATRSFEARRD